MQKLTPQQKRQLKGKSHALNPVVMIGQAGLTSAVLAEIDNALLAHELIKIRISGVDRKQVKVLAEEICKKTSAHLINVIGFIIAIYRENEDA